MKTIIAFGLLAVAIHMLVGCQLIQRVDKLCFQHDDGKTWCQCRDMVTNEYVECQ